jgi:hypothetical protein
MLSFTLNNKALVLDRNTTVQFLWRNPACNFDNYPGDLGLGIEIPVNDHNRSLFGNPERFERYSIENQREFPYFEIRYGGLLLMAGTFIIETADEKSYSGWLRSDTGNLGKKHREKFIFDSASFNEERTFINKSNYDPDTDQYGCPGVFNPDFFKEKGQKTNVIRLRLNPNYGKSTGKWTVWGFKRKTDDRVYLEEEFETEDLTEAFMINGGWKVNDLNPDGTVKAPETWSKSDPKSIIKDLKVNAVSPMLFLNYCLKTLFKDAEYSIRQNFIAADNDLKKLVIYHNFDITKIQNFSTSVTIITDYWSDGMVESYPKSSGYLVENISRNVNTFIFKDLLPEIKLKEFILGIQNSLNIFFHFVPGRKIVDIIDRESILDVIAIDIDQYLTGFWKIGEKKDTTLKFSFDHDKNDLYISQRWEDLSNYRDKEKEPLDTWEELESIENPETDEIRYVAEANGYAQYKLWLLEWDDQETGEHIQEKYIGWKLISIGFQNAFFNYGKQEKEEIKTLFSTLDGSTSANTRQKGNIRSELFAFETFTPRLFFYHGNNKGSYQTETLSLDWEKESIGLLEKRWKNWSRFWATRQQVETEAHFHLNMLDYMIRNIYRKFRCRTGEFIIEEMKTEFRINEIGQTNIKGFKLDYSPRVFTLDDLWQVGDIVWIDEWIEFEGLERFYPLII